MSREGETIKGYCKNCDKETGVKESTWVYVIARTTWGFPDNYWRCLGCGTRRGAS